MTDDDAPRGRDEIGEASWDRGMRAAYRPRRGVGTDGRGGSVMLRDVPDDPTPVVKLAGADAVQAPTGEGRYQIVGEIARGGIGVVLKSRDLDLGREVAMKVLRDEHASNPDVVQRFVEEAQIGGQLQHPGIVPVYEMGRGAAQRPYFTMKLVKGRTLSALLSARKDPGDDRRRFVAIFESVCMAIAYAHARGVIHRDLKPSNVMVGAFGEVQVVDWGLAKVLSEGGVHDERRAKNATTTDASVVATVRSGSGGSHSQVGSVMGTPAYMPPEQARGEIHLVDTRSDVFSLGAVLCEILTGRPPYEGTDREMVIAAAKAALGPAQERLAACGADRELVAIAEQCLAPAQQARPADASVVAAAIVAHLASIEERARAAELAAVEARAKAAEERRARRLTAALASVVVGAVVLGGCGYAMYRADLASRQATVARAVGAASDEATLLRGKAVSSGDASQWLQALAAAKRAAAFAESRDADDATRAKVASLLAQVEGEAVKAGAAAKQAAIDRAMVAQLEEICAATGDEYDYTRTNASYTAAYREYGIDPDALGAEDAVARVRASAIAVPLALSLEDWAYARRRLHMGATVGAEGMSFDENAEKLPFEEADRLVRIARAADPDPFRTRLRDAHDVATLQALAATAEADPAAIPAITLVRLGQGLNDAGDRLGAVKLMRVAVRLHPDDFWCNMKLRHYIKRGDGTGATDAFQFARVALALRPHSVEARLYLGSIFDRWDRHAEAIEMYKEALAIQPKHGHLYAHLSAALVGDGKFEEALAAARRAVELSPQDGYAWKTMFLALIRNDRLDEAEAEIRRAIATDPKSGEYRADLAQLLITKGDKAGALAASRESVRVDPRSARAHARLGAALMEVGDPVGAAKELKEALRLDPWEATDHSPLYRALELLHDHAGLLDAARDAVRRLPDDTQAQFALGRALSMAGDVDGAIIAYRASVAAAPRYAEAACNLGVLLCSRARYAEGLESLRRGHELGSLQHGWPYPTAKWVAHFKRLAAVDARFPAFMRGEIQPADPEEALEFAQVCHSHGLDRPAVALARRAFAQEPRLLSDPPIPNEKFSVGFPGWDAACYAACAGTGTSGDAYAFDDDARAAMRRQALVWARAALDACKRAEASGSEFRADGVSNNVNAWKDDRELIGVRNEEPLSRLPEDEQQEWRTMWADVDTFLQRTSPR